MALPLLLVILASQERSRLIQRQEQSPLQPMMMQLPVITRCQSRLHTQMARVKWLMQLLPWYQLQIRWRPRRCHTRRHTRRTQLRTLGYKQWLLKVKMVQRRPQRRKMLIQIRVHWLMGLQPLAQRQQRMRLFQLGPSQPLLQKRSRTKPLKKTTLL